MLERLMEEIKRRTLVVRIFPNAAACLRLVRALAVETHENWIEAMQYLNMEPLREQKKEGITQAGRCGVTVSTGLTKARRSITAGLNR
jgi:putative transposase